MELRLRYRGQDLDIHISSRAAKVSVLPVLTYRESGTLGAEGRKKIMQMEIDTSEPLRTAIRSGVDSGQLASVDVDLAAHDLLLMAHGWALKHWHLERTLQFDDYVTKQTALILSALLKPAQRDRYKHLL